MQNFLGTKLSIFLGNEGVAKKIGKKTTNESASHRCYDLHRTSLTPLILPTQSNTADLVNCSGSGGEQAKQTQRQICFEVCSYWT